MSLSLSVWAINFGFWQLSTEKEKALTFVQLLMAGAISIPIFYIHYIFSLLNLVQKKKKLLIIGYSITLIFLLLNFNHLFVKELRPILYFSYWPEAGMAFHFWLIWFLVGLSYGLYLLTKNLKESQGVKKEQIKYVILAASIAFLGGLTIFPLWYGILFPPIGIFVIFLYPLILSYAILRYRFMDIRVVLGRGTVYVLSFATVVAVAFSLIFLNGKLPQPIPLNVIGTLIIVLSIVLFQRAFRFFERLASKYFYYAFYSYQRVLTDLGIRLTQLLGLDKLASLITATLINTMKLERTVVLLRDPETGVYQIKKNIGFKEENGISLVKDNFLTFYLENIQKPLVYEELALAIRDTEDKEEKEKLEKLKENMKRIEAALCLPLFIEGKITGMIVLGNKLSGDPYSKQDIELLVNLSSQASISLQNAKLYSQVDDLSYHLQEKVDEQMKELKEAYEELRQLDNAKSEFISMASHQLRTPLTAIKGYVSMVLEGTYGELPRRMHKPLKNVLISNDRLVKIVNDLLNISKIELGKMELEKELTQVEELVKSCYEEMKIAAEKKNLKISLKTSKDFLPKIEVDQLKLRQVISNLIDNAIRYTSQGSVEIEVRKTDSHIHILVKDTGEGLNEKEKKEIFGGFIRGTAGVNFFVEGAGLGLYVAKKFLSLHNGKIWAESEGKGKGSTFYVELPITNS